MSTAEHEPSPGAGREPTEEELRAYEAELKQLRIEHVLLEQVVTLVNLGMRRTGLAAGTEDERDTGQVQLAIEAIRGLVPLLEKVAPAQAGPIRDALSRLQLAYVKIGGRPTPGADQPGGGTPDAGGQAGAEGRAGGTPGPGGAPPSPEPERPQPGEPGPAQRSGRLWVPGQ